MCFMGTHSKSEIKQTRAPLTLAQRNDVKLTRMSSNSKRSQVVPTIECSQASLGEILNGMQEVKEEAF